jgi:hypothetical protein
VFTSRSFILATVAALAAGTAFGVLAPVLEATGFSSIHVAHLVLAAGWSWAALAFCVGLARKSRVESGILAPASLVAAVVAYYVTKLERGEFLEAVNLGDPSQGTQVHWDGFVSKIVAWCIATVVLGLILGLAGNLAQSQGLRGLPFQVLIPLIAIVETSMRLRAEASLQGELASTTWSVTRLAAVAVIIALIGRAMIIRWYPPSAWR